MSSMLIMGVKPPKSCYVCSWYSKVQCPVDPSKKCYYRAERHPSCPFIEIPPHGDLIDRDALRTTTIHNPNHPPYITATDLYLQPVIVPAESEET